jgi:hypothetical protein
LRSNEFPSVSGYYARGATVTYVAIPRPKTVGAPLDIVDLATSDLRYKLGRIKNIIRIMNLCLVIEVIARIIGERNSPEFRPLHR